MSPYAYVYCLICGVKMVPNFIAYIVNKKSEPKARAEVKAEGEKSEAMEGIL